MSSKKTLDAGDKIDGGKGNDTLQIDMQGSFAGFSTTKGKEGFLKNVETVELSNETTSVYKFNATGVTDVESYVLNGNVNLEKLGDLGATITLNDRAEKEFSVAFADKVTSGKADQLSINLNEVGTAESKAGAADQKYVKLTTAGVETINLDSEGDNYVDLSNLDGATSLKLTGAGDTSINAVRAGLKNFDASKASGDLVADLTTATTLSTLKLGSGTNKVTVEATQLDAKANISGGAGADTLVVSDADGAIKRWALTDVETLQIGTLTTGDLNIHGDSIEGLEKIVVAAATLANDIKFTGMEEQGDLTIQLKGAQSASKALSINNSGATTINVDTPAATATVATPSANKTDVNLANSESVSINVASKMAYTGVVTANKASTVTVDIAGEMITSGAAEVVANQAESLTVTQVAKASELKVTAANLETLTVESAAKDFEVGAGSTIDKLATLTVTDSDGLFEVGALKNISSIEIKGGLGSAELGALGSATHEGAISLVAADLASNGTSSSVSLEVTSIDTKGGNVEVDASGVIGKVTLGTIDTTNGADEAGSVMVNVDGTGGDVTLAGITANEITINASEASKVIYGNTAFAADSSVTIHGSTTGHNTITGATAGGAVNITAAGKTLEATLNAGTGTDKFAITGTAKTEKIVVSGNLGAEAGDSVTIAAGATASEKMEFDTTGMTATAIKITGSAQDDTIKLGDSAETVIFAATAALNGKDTITGFTVGTGGDVLDFNALLSTQALSTAIVALGTTSAQTHASKQILFLSGDTGLTTVSAIEALFGAGAEFAAVASSEKLVLITDKGNIWYIDNDATAALKAGEVLQVGTIGTVDLADLVAANFGL